ncbi:MAG TPA: CPBP family intramembrane glutamic endopeptidase [Candidatus Dormibacteraeota bacterium]|nr:CPBP family intramembrane glutamic endopeptidase [Candidatus Dormibacteraeota bacterium]
MDALRRLYERATSGAPCDPDAGDLRDGRLAGLSFPIRASIAVFAVTALILVDQLHWLLPAGGDATTDVLGLRLIPVARFGLFLVAPLGLVLLAFRDRPGRYGLRLGDWRWGVALLLAGLAVMTPIILGLAGLQSFRSFYGGATVPLGAALLNNLVELIPAEFLLRGFLMFALWRRIGPLALVVVQVPFVLTHLGKPDVELWSTFIGGSIFAWLDWRTGSILWSALGHVYVLTLMLVAVGGATL